jgi:ankyrin repeat protein
MEGELEAWRAIQRGDPASLEEVLRLHPELSRRPFEVDPLTGWTLLLYAVDRKHRGVLDAALAHAPTHAPASADPLLTPLRLALRRGDLEAAGLLAERYPEDSREPELAYVLEEGVSVPSQDDARSVAFRLACRNALSERAVAALEAAVAADPALAALVSRQGGAGALVAFLVEHRHLHEPWTGDGTLAGWIRFYLGCADPENLADGPLAPPRSRPAASPEEVRVLECAMAGWSDELRELLVADPGRARARSMFHMPALYHPGAYGSPTQIECLELLLEHGAAPDALSALNGACWWGSPKVVRRLLEHDPDLARGRGWDRPLLMAAAATRWNSMGSPPDWEPILETLLEAGADPDVADRWGTTAWEITAPAQRGPLARHGAADRETRPGLEELLEALGRGARDEVLARADDDPELLDHYHRERGAPPLILALEDGDAELVSGLRSRRAELDLNEAAALDELPAMELALRSRGVTRAGFAVLPPERPLHFLAWFGGTRCRERLLEHGYSPGHANEPEITGDYLGFPEMRDATPRGLAARRGHPTFGD